MHRTLEAVGLGRRADDREGRAARGRWILRDVSVTVSPGDKVVVRGPSGSGKSVLLRALARLDPLQAGIVRWGGEDIFGERIPAYRRQVLHVPQRPALLDGAVESALRQPFTLVGRRHERFDESRARELLVALGRTEGLLEAGMRHLSGGEAQSVALVGALLVDPTVLLLDEPTAALDPASAERVERVLAAWVEERAPALGRALVWVSHDETLATRLEMRVVAMEAGTLR